MKKSSTADGVNVINLSERRKEDLTLMQEIRLLARNIEKLSSEIEECENDILKEKEEFVKSLNAIPLDKPYIVEGMPSHLSSIGVDSEILLVTMMKCRHCGEEWHYVYSLDNPKHRSTPCWFCPNGCNREVRELEGR